MRLFIERASLANPRFEVNRDNAPAIAQICYRLDGIPLALELAAARVKLLSAEQISARLDDRFRLLTGGARTALPRQQTLRALIDWSYDLLTDDERLLLRRLAVFQGGWTLELAEQVCSGRKSPDGGEQIDRYAILDMLGKLVDKSLVAVSEGRSGPRYRILETVRQYAREKLFESGEGAGIRDRHLSAFLDLAEEAEPHIRGADQLAWLDRLEEELDNLRAALEWSRESKLESCLRLTAALWRFWELRAHDLEAGEYFGAALASSEGLRTASRSRLAGRAGMFYRLRDRKRSDQLVRESAELARELDDRDSLVLALGLEGEARLNQPEAASLLLEEGLSICDDLGDHWSASVIWYSLADLAGRQGNPAQQLAKLQKGLAEARLAGDRRRISLGLATLAGYQVDHGAYAQAEEAIREGLALSAKIGDPNVAERILNLGNVYIFLEKYAEAEAHLLEARQRMEETDDQFHLTYVIVNLAILAWARDDLVRLSELADKALEIARKLDFVYVLAPASLAHGFASLIRENFRSARKDLGKAIRGGQKMNVNWFHGLGVAGLGMVALAEGHAERAAQTFGAYERIAPSLPPEPPFLVRKIKEQVDSARSQLGEERFEALAEIGRGMSLERTLDFVLGEQG